MKLKRHPFILFELLIAIGLLTLVAFPFIDCPFFYLKQQNSSLIHMEMARIAEKTLIETKAKFYQNIYSLENLALAKQSTTPDLEVTLDLFLPPNINRKVTGQIYFWVEKQKKTESNDVETFLININMILITPKKEKNAKFNSQIMIKQMLKKR